MTDFFVNEDFFKMLDELVADTKIIIDRPKGTQHPKYPDFIYKVNYGYLQHTLSTDGGGIDVWRGSLKEQKVNGIAVTVDCIKKNSEIKVLIGCTEQEMQYINTVQNKTSDSKGIIIKRP